jgi:hypothetical protein
MMYLVFVNVNLRRLFHLPLPQQRLRRRLIVLPTKWKGKQSQDLQPGICDNTHSYIYIPQGVRTP